MLIFLILVAVWNIVATGDRLYTYTYVIGSVAGAWKIRDWGYEFGIFK